MRKMDEKVMQFLQEQFNKIDKRFDEMDKRFDEVNDEFKLVQEQLSIIKEQTARNSEMAYSINNHEKRISDLETEIRNRR